MTQYEECFALFDTSDKIVALTGAGISTLSGIPDFRGKNGFYTDGNTWNGIRKEELLDIDFFREEPELFYRFAGEFLYPMLQRTPSIAHETLSLMQQKSLCHALYTQNIDCLHTKAGSRTFELHGSLDSHSCTRCNDHAPLQQVLDQVAAGKVPKCTCGGTLRPDFVFYGECLNEELLEQAFHDFETADLSVYETNKNILYKALTEMGFSCVEPGGTFYMFPEAPGGDAEAFSRKAKEFDLLLVPGTSFGCPGHFRISYCIDTEKVERSLEAFRKLAAYYFGK